MRWSSGDAVHGYINKTLGIEIQATLVEVLLAIW
jgi:hypothetical protein